MGWILARWIWAKRVYRKTAKALAEFRKIVSPALWGAALGLTGVITLLCGVLAALKLSGKGMPSVESLFCKPWTWEMTIAAILFSLLPWGPWIAYFLWKYRGKIRVGQFEIETALKEEEKFFLDATRAYQLMLKDISAHYSLEELEKEAALVWQTQVHVLIMESKLTQLDEEKRHEHTCTLATLLVRCGKHYLFLVRHKEEYFSALCQNGRFVLEKACKLDPSSADAAYYLGYILHEIAEKNHDLTLLSQARASLRRAIELAKNSAKAWYNLGVTYSFERKWPPIPEELGLKKILKSARQCYLQALKEDPSDWDATYNLACTDARLEREDREALTKLTAAFQLDSQASREMFEEDKELFQKMYRRLDENLKQEMDKILSQYQIQW